MEDMIREFLNKLVGDESHSKIRTDRDKYLAALERIAGRGCMHSPHYCVPMNSYDSCSPCVAAAALGLERRKDHNDAS